jgi:DNA-binding NarL/FixJ family response regulator
MASESERPTAHFEGLTPRELELLHLIATGRDDAQIAATLDLCEKAMRNHVTSIYSELQVESPVGGCALMQEKSVHRPTELIPERHEEPLGFRDSDRLVAFHTSGAFL